jgi:hypothetical protein
MKGAIVIRYALAAVLLIAAVIMSGCTVSCTIGEPGTTVTTIGAADTTTSPPDATTAPAPATTTTATTAAPTTSSDTTTGSTAKTTATSGKTSKTDDVSTTDASWVIVHPTLGPIAPFNQWTRYEETDPYVKLIGSWAFVASQYNSGGGHVWTTDVHASMVIPFKGTQIRLLATTWIGGGVATLTLDGGSAIEVDTYAATATSTAVVWTSPVLNSGTHHLTVGLTGAKNQNALMASLTIDAVEIFGTIGN